MQKKQPSRILPLYIFCGLIILGLALSLVFHKRDVLEKEEGETTVIEKTLPSQTILPEEIADLEMMKEIQESAAYLSHVFKEENSEEYFKNPFSVFTDLERKENKGIGVTYTSVPSVVAPEHKPVIQYPGLAARVVIIIDDMGISRKWSRKMTELSGPLTLSYLPYAEDLQAQADFAKKQNHHLMLHMPMEALGGVMLNTPGLLQMNTTQNNFLKTLQNNLDSFEGFYGVNNHMGSRLTQDRTKMNLVMRQLKKRHLYFIDSRTIHTSVVAKVAQENNVPFLIRDVFLDHEDNVEYVRAALNKLENIARTNDYAIAIGHPKEATYIALSEWLPTLAEKNIQLVHAGDLITEAYPSARLSPYKIQERPETFNISPVAAHINDPEVAD